jgi:hypothetical protein
MTDVGTAGAAAPAAGADAGSGPLPALETLHEAASNRFESLKADRAFGARVLAKDAAAVNERKTLLEILHGTGDDTSKAALAKSIALEPRETLASAMRVKAESDAAAAALAPNLGDWGRRAGPEVAAQVTADLSNWVRGLALSPDTSKALLQHIADEANVRHADEASAMAWLEREDKLLLDTARGDRRTVDLWRAQASKALAGSKYTLDSSFALNSAYAIRMLAIAGATKGN